MGIEGSQVLLEVETGRLRGVFNLPEATYRLDPLDDGRTVVYELAPTD